ncbi:MAG TPA: nicotinate phosphoribosyltransferase [Planctomycetaceae bacterium]|nr:nicotinate phosphoribosyltransferase [Planctomycetaceae bacterium]
MSAPMLLTDLYQLTMLQGYWHEGLAGEAVFELFVRKLPTERNFLIAAGLEQALEYLEHLVLTDEEADYLRSTGLFDDRFVDWLREIRFEGDVDAMPEGTVFFPNEPILRVTASIHQAQLVETRLINLLQFQTMIASKAARCVLAAPGRTLVEFGLRRAHGAEAGLLAARATCAVGFTGTSNVLAGQRYGLPIFGTMAHSYVMAHDNELDAFLSFARSQPNNVVLLIDTYDTLLAVAKVIEAARILEREGIRIRAVRIDAGDLGELSKEVRRRLDAAGLESIGIFVSGDLDEWKLRSLIQQEAPIGGFGVGTRLVTSHDAPYLNCAYKLEEYAGLARRKVSPGKQTYPGRKQVFRRYDDEGKMAGDTLAVADEELPGEPLLVPVMRAGKRVGPVESLEAIRRRTREQLERLPEVYRRLEPAAQSFPLALSDRLQVLIVETDRRLGLAR